ncbi:MAG: glutathione S-transferase N-terminal domain-containing protein [Leptolyngbyaceae cyanobacterium HOT.MB2.61]|nr:glutathione S-transferase N-terminal domain-containing protein [Leptolyngbyaceae cyanobacterium HOT.MB2.61]
MTPAIPPVEDVSSVWFQYPPAIAHQEEVMIKLFYAPGTCALAPHIVLEWIGEPYELEKVQLGSPEYLKINPLGQVPAMIDGDSDVMNQPDAILKYLAQKYPDAKLGSNGTLQDAYELNRWLAFFTGDFHPAFYPYFRPNRYWIEEDENAHKTIKEAPYKLIVRVFAHLNNHLEGKDYIVGDRLTVADPYAFAMIRWGNYIPNKPLSDYANVFRFYQQFKQDNAVQRAMSQQGIK